MFAPAILALIGLAAMSEAAPFPPCWHPLPPRPCDHYQHFPVPVPAPAQPLPSFAELQSLLNAIRATAGSTTAAPQAVTSTTQAPVTAPPTAATEAKIPSLAELQSLLNALGISLPAAVNQAPAVVTQAPAVAIQAPAVVTQAPAVATQAPAVVNEAQAVVN
ncbi:unnamed protein product [Nezara viridula]|uniref:Neuropeptide n=1 Tax=Nezara viridula TaxID=85310 RepID=A0A9P0MR03_NEZVI|nr:unnamed protein product [Nezara viridula]